MQVRLLWWCQTLGSSPLPSIYPKKPRWMRTSAAVSGQYCSNEKPPRLLCNPAGRIASFYLGLPLPALRRSSVKRHKLGLWQVLNKSIVRWACLSGCDAVPCDAAGQRWWWFACERMRVYDLSTSRSGEARRVMRVSSTVWWMDGALLSLALLGGYVFWERGDIPRVVGADVGKERLTMRVCE